MSLFKGAFPNTFGQNFEMRGINIVPQFKLCVTYKQMKHLFYYAFIFVIAGCKDVLQTKVAPLEENTVAEPVRPETPHPGKQILEQECYICHNPKASMSNRIAPPMESIKRNYIGPNTTKEQFTEALVRWVNDPETASKMPGAHAKFGPMPYMPNPDDAVAQIADYIYDNEIERPEWFDAHFQKAHQKGSGMGECGCFDQDPEKEYAAIGLAFAMEAKTELGKNLKKAIQEKGTIGAIQFCHVEATKLTDSVSLMKNAVIKRVSDKTRNPNNKANQQELGHIASFKKILASGKGIEPIVNSEDGEVDFYYPITTNVLCLQCHGKPNEQIQPKTLMALKELYPEVVAIGYDVNEVRGIWSINFNPDN